MIIMKYQELKTNIMVFIISLGVFFLSVVLALFLSVPIYQQIIPIFNLESISGLSIQQLMMTYKEMIDYLTTLSINPSVLSLTYFPISPEGQVHFQDVQQLMMKVYGLLMLLVPLSIYAFSWLIKYGRKKQVNIAFKVSYVAPLVLIVLMTISFEKVFILFHQLVFSNNYWLFDPLTDPVINILPESFFMVLFILALLLYEVIIVLIKSLIMFKF